MENPILLTFDEFEESIKKEREKWAIFLEKHELLKTLYGYPEQEPLQVYKIKSYEEVKSFFTGVLAEPFEPWNSTVQYIFDHYELHLIDRSDKLIKSGSGEYYNGIHFEVKFSLNNHPPEEPFLLVEPSSIEHNNSVYVDGVSLTDLYDVDSLKEWDNGIWCASESLLVKGGYLKKEYGIIPVNLMFFRVFMEGRDNLMMTQTRDYILFLKGKISRKMAGEMMDMLTTDRYFVNTQTMIYGLYYPVKGEPMSGFINKPQDIMNLVKGR